MTNKRRGGSSTSSDRKHKSCKSSEETTGSSHLDVTLEEEFRSFTDSAEDAWSKLSTEATSNLSGSVVSLSSSFGDEKGGVSPEELTTSTCAITESGIGGPLVDFEGNFVGMNLSANARTPFLPRSKIWEI
ncbi:hypothetical protein EJB05_46087 [Eragrostis curvula]|uniref:Uncharacterized protein n=1 Tax=Eragrostis curvula TaxID=38414 RepID=A0A5J9TM89_9POAL|nr:hypothetical protein EJB05_46087 [Eragrostis curvula]